MKVLILSTFDRQGGAAVSARRLVQSINKHSDVEVYYATLHDDSKSLTNQLFKKKIFFWLKKWALFSLERIAILLSVKKKEYLYKFSLNNVGFEIHNHPLVQEADLIHLHWINFSFLSINEIERLSTIKPVAWTLHDMWAFTGGCHYAGSCTNYMSRCENCYLLRLPFIAESILKWKTRTIGNSRICLISPSTWMKRMAAQSSLGASLTHYVIPNAIDIGKYRPMDKSKIRKKYGLHSKDDYYILFGAMDLNDARKGFVHLYTALNKLKNTIPNLHLLTFGSSNVQFNELNITSFGQINSELEIIEIYNLADVFVLPSVEDNLPNTVMEALSCGIPVVAFDCGGVSDMIDHKKNGFLGRPGKEDDLSEGMIHYMDQESRIKAGQAARKKVAENYSEKIIALRHIELYRHLISNYETNSNRAQTSG